MEISEMNKLKNIFLIAVVAWLSVATYATAANPFTVKVYGTKEYPLDQPLMSGGALFDTHFNYTGGATRGSVIFHPGALTNSDGTNNDPYWPNKLSSLGFPAPSISFLDLGLGGQSGNFVVPFGPSLEMAGTMLGPVVAALNKSNNSTAKGIAGILSGPNGGLVFGPNWTAHAMVNNSLQSPSHWRFTPGYFSGAAYKFGGAPTNTGTSASSASTPDAFVVKGDLHGKLSLL